MGIVNWFTNNIESKERVLTRDLLSMAIADGEFMEEERQEIERAVRWMSASIPDGKRSVTENWV